MTLLSLDTVVPRLLERKALRAADIMAGPFRVEDRSRRNRNFKVVPAKAPGLLVKQATDEHSRATVKVEGKLLAAARRDPAFKQARWFFPQHVADDAKDGLLVTRLVHPATSLRKYHLNAGDPRFHVDAAETAAHVLAGWHLAGAKALREGRLKFLPRDPPGCWGILETFARTPTQEVSPTWEQFGRALHERVTFRDRVEPLRKRWSEFDGVVHGDARWENFLLTSGAAPTRDLNVRLIDWELASRGDEAWDLAVFLVEYLRFWQAQGAWGTARTLAEAEQGNRFPLRKVHPASRAFWRAYVTRRRWGRDREKAARSRVGEYLPFALLWMGAETLLGQPTLPPAALVAIDLAQQAADDPKRCMAAWWGLR